MIALFAVLSCTAASPCAFENVRVEVGDGTTLDAATVVLDGTSIRSVGAAPAPAGATRIDGKGKVLTPGLIETRSTLGIVEIGLEPSTNDSFILGRPAVPGFRAADAFNPFSEFIAPSREEGVTHAITAPGGAVIHGTGAWVALTGRLQDRPRAEDPAAVFASVDAPAGALLGGSHGAAWMLLREALADARAFLLDPAAYEQNRRRTLSLPRLQLEALVPVLQGKIPLVLEVDRAADILGALELAKAERIRLVIAGGGEAWLVAGALAAARVPVILTPTGQDPASFDQIHARDDAPALLDAAGVPLILSTASWDNNARRLRQEAGIAVSLGLPRERALRAVTLAPARAFGRPGGLIAPGQPATVVLWSGDPLELSTIAERVLIDGREYESDSRQRRLAKRYGQAGLPEQ